LITINSDGPEFAMCATQISNLQTSGRIFENGRKHLAVKKAAMSPLEGRNEKNQID
jgi:hypothetical protein